MLDLFHSYAGDCIRMLLGVLRCPFLNLPVGTENVHCVGGFYRLRIDCRHQLLWTWSYKFRSSWQANVPSSLQVIPHLLWNPEFITFFTRDRHLSVCRARWIHSTTSHLSSLKSVLLLSSHLCLILPSILFPSRFFTKSYKHFFSPPTHPTPRISSSCIWSPNYNCQLAQHATSHCAVIVSMTLFTFCCVGPNFFSSPRLPNALSLCSCCNMRDQVLHPSNASVIQGYS